MGMNGHTARRLCWLVDQMNVLPGRWHLSAQDIIWLDQNLERFRSGTKAGMQEATKLIAELLPEAKLIIEYEAADQRSDLVETVAYTVVAAIVLAIGISLLVQGQFLLAALPISAAVAVLSISLIIGPIVRRRRRAYWDAFDDELGRYWMQLELLAGG